MAKRKKTPLSITHPRLMDEWSFEKNGDFRPESITYGSHKRPWWVCKKCGYFWQARIADRAMYGSGCPSHSNKIATNKNNLAVRFPEIAAEWHPTKNGGLRPKDVVPGSHKKVFWGCLVCGNEWRSVVNKRTLEEDPRGCPVCGVERQVESFIRTVVNKSGSLAEVHPELLDEWDYSKNKIKPTEISYGSKRKVHWICKKKGCGYGWKATITDRTGPGKTGCPACNNRVVTETNSLKVKFPEIAAEWHPNKNGVLKPEDVVSGSNEKVWWECSVCFRPWFGRIVDRTGKYCGCPQCSKGPVSKISQKWLDQISVKIREYYIKELGFRVDGYGPETNTVYEFLGDYWHGNPEKYSPKDINEVNKVSFGKLYNRWLKRKKSLENAGYKVVYIWESDFREQMITGEESE